MSLINDLLKQLAAKQAQPPTVPELHLFKQYPHPWPRPFIYLAIAFSAAFLLAAFYWYTHPRPRLTPHNLRFTPVQVTKSPLLPATATFETTWMRNISLQSVDKTSQLAFKLSQNFLYQITYQPQAQRLTIQFENTKLSEPSLLSNINYINTGIKEINLQSKAGASQADIILEKGVEIASLNTSTINPELIITFNLQQLPLIKSPTPLALLTEKYQQALQEANKGHIATATKELLAVIHTDPSFEKARLSLIGILLTSKRLTQARELIEAGLASHPQFAPYLELKARLLAKQGRLDQALNLLLTVQPTLTEFPEYYALLASFYERKNNDLFAAKIYRSLINVNPENGNWWFGLAASLDKLGYKQEAMQAYMKAIEVGNLNPQIGNYIGERLKKMTDRTEHETQ